MKVFTNEVSKKVQPPNIFLIISSPSVSVMFWKTLMLNAKPKSLRKFRKVRMKRSIIGIVLTGLYFLVSM